MQNRHGPAGPYRSYNETRSHEMTGDPMSVRKRRRPGSPALMNFATSPHGYYSVEQDLRGGTMDEINTASLPSHNSIQASANTTNPSPSDLRPPLRPFVLIPSGHQPPENIAPLDILTCQNVEMFQATAADVADHESSTSGGMSVTVGQIGFRCIHCAKSPFAKAELSSIFPAAVGSIVASINVMTDVHFSKCTNILQHVKLQIQDKNGRGRGEGDEEWHRASFVNFCVDLCKREGVINRTPAQTGLVLGSQGSTSEKVSTDQGSNSGSFGGHSNSIVQPTPLPPKRMRVKEQENTSITLPDAPGPYSSNSGDPGLKQHTNGSQPMSQTRQTNDLGSGRPPLSRSPHDNMNSFDNPGSMNFPFVQNQNGCWECRFCWGQMQRPPGYLWQSSQPPHQSFMEQHLGMCQGQNRFSQGGEHSTSQQSSFISSYIPEAPGQYGQHQSNWNTSSSQHQSYQQSPQRSLSPYSVHPQMSRPPQGPYTSQMQPTTPHPQDYSYQMQIHPFAAQMYGDMGQDRNIYDPMGQHNIGQGYIGTTPNEQGRAEDAKATTKAALEHLQKAEEEREKENKNGDDESGQLVLDEDKSLLTDYFYHVMKQLQICRFSEGDRKTRGGKRENIAIGYGGLQCVHCADSSNSRKFFWSNVDRLANSFAEIPSHVLKCRRCPVQTKYALKQLKVQHPQQMTTLPRGSQKVFFRRMWRRLHDDDPGPKDVGTTEAQKNLSGDCNAGVVETPSKDSALDSASSAPDNFIKMSTENAAKTLAACTSNPSENKSNRILLAIDEDKEWLSDMDCFIRKNLEVFCAEGKDVEAAQEDRKYPITEGQIGIRCIYCASTDGDCRGSAVAFPYSIGGIYEAVREFQRVHLDSCPCLPSTFNVKLNSLKGSSSLSSVLRRYYVQAAEALGMHDTADGIRAGAKPKAIGGRSAKIEVEDEENTSTTNLDESIRATELENDAVVVPLSDRKRKYSSDNYG